uniref:Uncharacterized protein n=1 Tax=Panagrolaimus sp. PS1159 TaxID=55785 RepID=A0AC35FJG2_9BILA
MSRVVQYNAGLILWVGSEAGWTSMHRWVECALQPSCMAPLGSTKSCTMKNISQSRFSGCHRFDQAAINLILYENSNSTTNLYQRNTNYFKIIRRRNLFVKPKIKATTMKRIFTNTTKSVVGDTTKRPFSTSKITKLQSSDKSAAAVKVTKSFSPIMSTYNKKDPTIPNILKTTTFFNTSYISITTVFPTKANNVSTSANVIEFDLVEESLNGSISKSIPDSKKSTITTKLPQTSVTP